MNTQRRTKVASPEPRRFSHALMALTIAFIGLVGLLPTYAFAAKPAQATAGSNERTVPIKGSISEKFSVAPCPAAPMICVKIQGVGKVRPLHETHAASSIIFNATIVMSDGCTPEARYTTFTTRNGDKLHLLATGETCRSKNTSADTFVVTGGTGRFKGATGSGTDSDTRTFSTPTSGTATTLYQGSITLRSNSG